MTIASTGPSLCARRIRLSLSLPLRKVNYLPSGSAAGQQQYRLFHLPVARLARHNLRNSKTSRTTSIKRFYVGSTKQIMPEKEESVLVTGGSGFLAAQCILQLLNAGYHVRTTVRSTSRENDVREMLKYGAAANLDSLTFAVADLTKDDGWTSAVDGCIYVLHVASPFPPGAPKHEDDLIIPAREGTLRVLRASRDAGVKRIVVTSSFAAIGYGHPVTNEPFTEDTWTNSESADLSPDVKSKTLAERAAWDFIKSEGGSMELATINPTAIFGPVLGKNPAASVQLVQRMLKGHLPGCPQLMFGVVDVRDVADLHISAMTSPQAKGERFLAVSPPSMTVLEIAQILRNKMGKAGQSAPTRVIPNFLIRLGGLVSTNLALTALELGKTKNMDNEKAKRLLGWEPRSGEEAILASAESLIKLGLV
jgi:nucleoside-diphosphate-sugar epimerase